VFIGEMIASISMGGLVGKVNALVMARIKIFGIAREIKGRMGPLAEGSWASSEMAPSSQLSRSQSRSRFSCCHELIGFAVEFGQLRWSL
jgi:hypothetical protein